MVACKTEDYQLLGDVLDQGLKELGYSREDLNVEWFASDKQHNLDLYCSRVQKSKGYRRSKQLYLGLPSEALRVGIHNIQKKQPDPFILHNLSCGVGVQFLQELQEPPSLPSRSLVDGRVIKYFCNIPRGTRANGTAVVFSPE